MLKKVDIYTDGACSGNPGAGGYAAILRYGEREREIVGGEAQTTNNRMELCGVINGLSALKEKCDVTIYSDSAYVVSAFENGWIDAWIANGWRTSAKDDVKNRDLWQQLLLLTQKHNVTFVKVKGHSDNVLNNRCDALARAEIQKISDQNGQEKE